VDARAVVNAAGPWVDRVRRLEDPAAGRSVVLAKGVHALVSADAPWEAALTIPQDRLRVTFAVPFYGMLLLGTTDEPHDGEPSEVAVEATDVDQVVSEAAVAVEPSLVAAERVRATFAGLRVLPAATRDSVSARRETVLSRGRGGMLSVAGGKLTTYRRIALGTLERLRSELGLHRIDQRPWPLPGVGDASSLQLPADLDPALRNHLLHLYGSLATQVLAPALDDPTLLEPIHPEGPDIAVQALYAATNEWAVTPEDVLRRRTTVFYRGLADEDARRRVEELLARASAAATA
jgi:glycerol-3-phosphate dehydrogenase